MIQQSIAHCPRCGHPSSLDAGQPDGETLCIKCGGVFTLVTDDDAPVASPRAVATAPGHDEPSDDELDLVPLAPQSAPAMRPTTWTPPPPPTARSSSPFAVPGWRPRGGDAANREPRKWTQRPLVKAIGTTAVVLLVLLAAYAKIAKRTGAPSVGSLFKSTGPPPAMTFRDDGAGRRVGTAAVRGRKAAATDVRLVLPPGQHANASLPCVFVCPARSNLLVGVPFGPGEQEDFYPFLRAGIAVCFYTLDGTVNLDTADERQILSAIGPYRASGSGMHNLSDAIDTVLAGTPAIDPTRLATCGHSSAGTIAVMAAVGEPRISAVAAMAPALDLPKRLEPVVSRADAKFGQWVRSMSPSEITRLPCPVWIYQMRDDDNVPLADAERFAATHGPGRVTLRVAPSGGHAGAYEQGMPEAVAFLAKALGAR